MLSIGVTPIPALTSAIAQLGLPPLPPYIARQRAADDRDVEDYQTIYAQGEKAIAIHSCGTCGCTTHWENLTRSDSRMAVNLKLAEPEIVKSIAVRHFDGADKWEFMD